MSNNQTRGVLQCDCGEPLLSCDSRVSEFRDGKVVVIVRCWGCGRRYEGQVTWRDSFTLISNGINEPVTEE